MKRLKPMNNDEAKLILQAYRPAGQDARDPRFREALEQARRDPELGRWLANEQALDARIGDRIRTAVQPPPFLRTRLLAQRVTARPVAWWRRPLWQMAVAAGFIALLGLVLLRPTPPIPSGTGFAAFRSEMAGMAGRGVDRLDLLSSDVTAVRRWLADNEAPADLVLPAGLDGRPSLGCRVLDWNGHRVSLLCFRTGEQEEAHLLVVDSRAFSRPPGGTPVYARMDDVGSMGWTRGDKTYLLVAKGADQDRLSRML